MNRAMLACLLAAFSISLGACKDKEMPKEPTEVAPTPSATAPAPVVTAPPAPAPEPPPTEADFEEEATQQITNKNLEEELDKLERELKSP